MNLLWKNRKKSDGIQDSFVTVTMGRESDDERDHGWSESLKTTIPTNINEL